ncbi:MAG TPA: BREX-6 system phosphatase PglZ [Sandaracinaceae bacterium LLY-WYZ-13_1]|nr:BREX-6 system phosphatase PglZ [Sandaracinaceae bacterium LLY-WYZ-13_1]
MAASPEATVTRREARATAAPLGPVSGALEEDLQTWVRRQGVVVWLDLDEHYTGFVDRLIESRAAGALKYEVKAFRGSYLELMMALEDLTGGVEKPRLLVHLPGFNEETVKTTPLYELYKAGVRYRKSLDTLVTEAATGLVKPEEIAAFGAGEDLTIEGAHAWLRGVLDRMEGGLAAQLRAISACALVDDLLGGGFVAKQLGVAAAEQTLWEHLGVALALPADWRGLSLGTRDSTKDAALRPDDVAFTVASWALSVEYVDDLRRVPIAPRLVGMEALPKGIREACHELAAHLRERHPEFYRRTADETETLIGDEVRQAEAADLGRIDTFWFEEEKVLTAAVSALAERRWGLAAEYADVRVDGDSFWLRRDPSRQSAWQLVAAAAALGQAVELAGEKLGAQDHHEALDAYTERGAAVDRAHRRLEQLRLKLLSPQLPEFEALRARLDEMREVWRAWADGWAEAFNALCQREGFLPPSELQQRQLFDEVVRPEATQGKTAYFVVDALRYEMGEELHRAIAPTPATKAQLAARYAELPTNTEIGMNVLAPVATNGRLTPSLEGGVFKGFSNGEFRVRDPETRRRAMHARVGGATCPWLSLGEVLARDTTSLKQAVAQANLVVVHSEEIDKAGEKGVGPALFDTVMQQIRSAWQLLRDAGVRRFVFTSDHGFLLMDGRTTLAKPHGRKIDPKRRHVVSTVAADHDGEVRVPLSDLGYEGVEGQHLMFPVTTAPFDTGKRKRTFVHGGNSLQERVIPVLTVTHRAASGGSTLKYRVTAKALEGVAGMHCLEARVDMITEQATLDFGSVRELELALRVTDIPEVSVELCQTRRGARLENGVLVANVGEDFELFFRLMGRTDARALVALHHPSRAVDVEEGGPDQRFTVGVAAAKPAAEEAPKEPKTSAPTAPSSWLEKLPEGGVREVFAHIEAHGVCVEDEAAQKLGSPRALRRFSAKFEEYAALAPFEARIEVVGGVKRYVREGTTCG